LQPFPYPLRKILAGGVLEAFNLIEAMMIELVEQGLKGPPQVGKIHHPARFLTNRATDMDFNPERVSMHAGTFVPLRDIGKPMSRFDLKYSKNIHERIVTPKLSLRNHNMYSLPTAVACIEACCSRLALFMHRYSAHGRGLAVSRF